MTRVLTTTGDLSDLVRADTPLEVVATGFAYTEGAAWDAGARALLFNDIPNDSTYRWTQDGGAVVERHPSHFANGMGFDAVGRLVVCEAGANRIVRRETDGSWTVLASHYEGRELNSPNDLAFHATGGIYFTDPAYGRIPVYGQDRPAELEHRGVYRVDDPADGPVLQAEDFGQPNGICFAPDQRLLYVNDTERARIDVFDVAPDGGLSGRRVFREDVGPRLSFEDARRNVLPSGYVDGMKCDEHGNVYVTGPGGVWVLAPTGEHRGVIELPEDLANFAWGGEDGRSLFVCCRSFVARIAMRVRSGVAGAVA